VANILCLECLAPLINFSPKKKKKNLRISECSACADGLWDFFFLWDHTYLLGILKTTRDIKGLECEISRIYCSYENTILILILILMRCIIKMKKII